MLSENIRAFAGHLLAGDAEAVSAVLNDDLLNGPSSFDFKEENSYHMFIYGLLYAASADAVSVDVSPGVAAHGVAARGLYTVHSNREAGKGRSDCVLKPTDKNAAAVVIEFKHLKKDPSGGSAGLMAEAQEGLGQIKEKAYDHDLRREGYTRIYKYGIAFHGKRCAVAMEREG